MSELKTHEDSPKAPNASAKGEPSNGKPETKTAADEAHERDDREDAKDEKDAKDAKDANEEDDANADEKAEKDDAPPKVAAKEGEKKSEEEGPDLIVKGNPLRRGRGGVTAAAGAIGAFLLMAKSGQASVGVPLGLVFVAVAAFGVMDLLGTFDDAEEHVATTTTLRALGAPIARTIASLGVFGGSLSAAGAGVGAQWIWAIVVTASFLLLVASVFDLGVKLGPWKKDELGLERPLLSRHGFWVVAAGGLLYFPTLGMFSLWDPWETHYGEVAREILSRDDWISLWWAQDGWFWSKPILNFWIQALSMASLGTHYRPDQMLMAAGGATAHPEWVVRAPNVLLTVLAMYLLYKGVAKVFGRRAGLVGGLVLATMPDWFFLAHQTMTDMPFVAPMTAAMGLLLVGVNTDEEARVKLYEVKAFGTTLRFSGWHLVFGAILLCVIPQILYLMSRNLELVTQGDNGRGFRFHWDEFKSGSAGNCALPGNEACNPGFPASIPKSVGAHPDGIVQGTLRLFGSFEPVIQGLVWAGVLGGLLYVNWGERRARRLWYIAAWFFAAIATMGKGPAGFILPMICAFAYVATKKRWSELLRLEMMSGILVILCVAIPWYVAMYVRHGSPFTDRLIFHDMFNRAFSHVHDTNEGDDTSFRFYIWQLGYAIFPWTGLAPLALTYWLRRGDSADRGRGDASVFLVMWFLFGFALFSFMGTKFHHYIFPAVPPIAMLVGVIVDEMLGDKPLARKGTLPLYAGGLGAGAALAAYGVSRFFPGSIFGDKLGKDLATPSPWMGAFLAVAGLAAAALAVAFFREPTSAKDAEPLPAGKVESAIEQSPYRGGVRVDSDPEEVRRLQHEQLMIGAATLLGAFVLALVGRDLATKPEGADQPGAIRLLQLFTYNYRRAWPDSLDFSAVLAGFTLVAILLAVLSSVKAIRRHVGAALVAFACVWAVWGLDVYMMKTSPHWGQHEVMEAYYKNRQGPQEPLVAYQMNWKGENFYTGNHIPAFVSSGANFANWMKAQREKGVKVMYFVTEHSRTGGLRSEVNPKAMREITDKALCNKFVLVRAEL